MSDQQDWRGIHPHAHMGGWIVVGYLHSDRLVILYHSWTRRGAERKARGHQRHQARQQQWDIEAGLEPAEYGGLQIRRMKDHPGRS